ncbi:MULTISPECIES: DUF3305 domain-containing protein [unclassified Ferrimonas]|uniref:DUF3305 domain-containing protein n=1 Tax=unclassified Ferrimonas TaxID=2620587 RepID=UPI0025736724|nr:DUF3305 domain-containing protein [Ferrimonas sp. YFM]BDY06995.1 hypothetical protein F0521_40360 [Ferrimonas sp. YFM]
MQRTENIWPLQVKLKSEQVTMGRWSETRWSVDALLPGDAEQVEGATLVGLELHLDERANYRLNLDLDNPLLFVVCDEDESGQPIPMLVTANQNIAAGCLESDQPVFTYPLPKAVGCWIEAFITRHGEQQICAHRRKHIDVRGEMKERREKRHDRP